MRRIFLIAASCVATAVPGALSAQASANDLSPIITPGGHIDIAVPNGKARSVSIDLSDVIDSRGSIAGLKVEAVRGRQSIGRRTALVREPGGSVTLQFARPFDRVRIHDSEGSVTATVSNIQFCPIRVMRDGTCLSAHGPIKAKIAKWPIYALAAGETPGTVPGTVSPGDRPAPVVRPSTPQTPVAPSVPTQSPGEGAKPPAAPVTPPSTPVSKPTPAPAAPPAKTPAPTPAQPETPSQPPVTPTLPPEVIPEDQNEEEAPEAPEETPETNEEAVFGETRPIDRENVFKVQIGSGHENPFIDKGGIGSYCHYSDIYNNIKTYMQDVKFDENGLPIFPNGDRDDHVFLCGDQFFGSGNAINAISVEAEKGSWALSVLKNDGIEPNTYGMSDHRDSALRSTFKLLNDQAQFRYRIRRPLDERPRLIREKDANGADLGTQEDLEKGVATTREWRRRFRGVGEVRVMDISGALGPDDLIRYDRFPDSMDSLLWKAASPITGGQNAQADLGKGTGYFYNHTPLEARLRMASEVGAIYHHNFPCRMFEHKGNYEPGVIGQRVQSWFARQEVPLEVRESLLNDTPYQHVDEFGEDMLEMRELVTDDKVLVEIANEIWNYAPPYRDCLDYMERRHDWLAEQRGFMKDVPAAQKSMVQAGYDSTIAIARLRREFPELQWVGIAAIHTANFSDWVVRPQTFCEPPETPSRTFNLSLYSFICGYQQARQDIMNDPALSADLAIPPETFGDWFRVQGTTYFLFSYCRTKNEALTAQRCADVAPRDRIYTPGGYDLRQLVNLQESEIKSMLSMELRDFITKKSNEGRADSRPGETAFSLDWQREAFVALAEHAAAEGAQTGAYEGGNHRNWGSESQCWNVGMNEAECRELRRKYARIERSTEWALMQAAVHDEARDAGWITVSEFEPIGAQGEEYSFAAARDLYDVTARYCETVRFFVPNVIPMGMTALNVGKSPQQMCGGMDEYLANAKDNNYYIGNDIPDPWELIPGYRPYGAEVDAR